MKRKKQWFAVILAALLTVGQGIVSAAPAERTEEAVTAEADESALQEETGVQTEEQPESASAAASEKNQEITEKQGVKEAKVSQEIGGGVFHETTPPPAETQPTATQQTGGGYFQKKEIIPLRC